MAVAGSRVVTNPQSRHTCSRSASCLGFASPHGQSWLVPRGSTDKNLRPALSAGAAPDLQPQAMLTLKGRRSSAAWKQPETRANICQPAAENAFGRTDGFGYANYRCDLRDVGI